jgi:hypothetical protein
MTHDTERPLRWTCDTCQFPIADGAGYLYVDPGDEDDTVWHMQHGTCDPGGIGYAIAIERVRTHAQLLAWTAHLMGKRWLERTNWDTVIRNAAGVTL